MNSIDITKSIIAGLGAGAANGLLGAGGGMILVLLLRNTKHFQDKEIFASSAAIMIPISIISLLLTGQMEILFYPLLPYYLAGSFIGGIAAGRVPLPSKWLHWLFGALITAGGIRYLC